MFRKMHVRAMSWMIVLATVAGISTSTMARAQATIGAGDGKDTLSVDFYKVPPGKQDEWLALYKKYHYPIMQYQKAHGQVISETVYTRAIHQLSPSWDFAIVIVAPPADKRPKPEYTRSQLIRKLFPDIDDYVKGEKARWFLTLDHWDESWTEVDIDKHPSLYEPF
jgi:hypothetical protein